MSAPAPRSGRSGSTSKQALRLWLRLLACENIIENRIRTALRERFHITLPQFDVLAELEYLGRPLTMTELSKRLMVSNGNVTGVVDRLVREGCVDRRPSSGDRRVQLISLTPRGVHTFREVAAQHERWIAELFSGMGTEDLDQLAVLLTRAHDMLKAGRPKPPDK
ncbi:MAG: MarR family transcriptional regulator [Gammaproteobacteria bacterium]|nr:MarR family transcriptional regulator [Gammaproteobacteria bacterium]